MYKIFLGGLIFILFQYSRADEGNWKLIDRYEVKSNTGIWASEYIAMECADKNNCMAFGHVNNCNRLGRATTDGGKTWQTVYRDSLNLNGPNIFAKVADFAYPDTSLALVLCDSCLVLRSTDKGNSWSEQRLNCKVNDWTWNWMDIKMFDKNFGAIVSYWDIYVTTDGGLSWDRKDIPHDDSSKWTGFDDLSIPDSNTILMTSYDSSKKAVFVRYSTDRGNNWNFNPPVRDDFRYYCLSFKDKDKGWALQSGQIKPNSNTFKNVIIYTNDRGKNWTKQLDSLPGELAYLTGLEFSDSLNGIAWSRYSYRLWNTTDGGKNWKKIDSYATASACFRDMKMIDRDTWLGATGYDMYIYKYAKTTGTEFKEPPEYADLLRISPNVLNLSDELNISLFTSEECHIKFEIINSIGDIVDYSDTYYLNQGENYIQYNARNINNSGSYWLRAIKNGQTVSIRPFIFIQ